MSKNQSIGTITLIVVLLLDIFVPLGIAIGILYAASFFFVSKESIPLIKRFTVITVILIFMKLVIFKYDADYKSYINRGISVFAIGTISFFSIRQRKLQDKIDNDKRIYINLLKRKNAKLQTYQTSLNLTLLLTITDVHGKIIYANDQYCLISKFSKEELIGQNHRLVKSDEHTPHFYKQMWDTIRSGKIWRGEVKSKAKDGSCFWADTVILPIKDLENVVTEYFILRLPITEKKILQIERDANLKAFESILWKVSHQLRGPIATCMALKNLMNDQVNNMDEVALRGHEHRQKCTSELDGFSREITEFIYVHNQQKLVI